MYRQVYLRIPNFECLREFLEIRIPTRISPYLAFVICSAAHHFLQFFGIPSTYHRDL